MDGKVDQSSERMLEHAVRAPAGEGTAVSGHMLGGRYLLCELCGGGASAHVYRAVDSMLGGKEVAIKLLHSHLARGETAIERFKNEALVGKTLHHPSIVGMYDFCAATDDHGHYLVMEYCAARPAREILFDADLRLNAEKLRVVLLALCSALRHAHERGVIHRDIKLSNVLFLADGTVKLADFGGARLTEGYVALTATGECVGTPGYMAPELLRASEATVQSDLYALGVLAVELANGAHPFEGWSIARIASESHRAAALRPSKGAPPWLESFVAGCTEPNPHHRLSSAADAERVLGGGNKSALLRRTGRGALRFIWRSLFVFVIMTLMGVAVTESSRSVALTTAPYVVALQDHLGGWSTAILRLVQLKSLNRSHLVAYAAEAGDRRLVQFLLWHGASPDTGNPLTSAIERGDARMVGMLLRSNVHFESNSDTTSDALILAVRREQPEIINLLLAFDADPLAVRSVAGEPVCAPIEALKTGNEAVIRALFGLERVRRSPWCEEKSIAIAVVKITPERAANLDLDYKVRNRIGRTPLMQAVAARSGAVVAQLLQRSEIDANAADPRGLTALHYAVLPSERKRKDRYRLSGAKMNQAFNEHASQRRIIGIFLKDPRTNLEMRDSDGETPLMLLIRQRRADLDFVRMFVEAGADIGTITGDGTGLIAHANLPSNLAVVRWLLNLHRIDVNAPDRNGARLFVSAARMRAGGGRLCRMLLEAGADPRAPGADGATPIVAAVSSGTLSFVRCLVEESHIDLRTVESSGIQLVELARNRIDGRGDAIVAYLLAQGAEPAAGRASDTNHQ